jgi:hypothetical protein
LKNHQYWPWLTSAAFTNIDSPRYVPYTWIGIQRCHTGLWYPQAFHIVLYMRTHESPPLIHYHAVRTTPIDGVLRPRHALLLQPEAQLFRDCASIIHWKFCSSGALPI